MSELWPVGLLFIFPVPQQQKVEVTTKCEICNTVLIVVKRLVGQNATEVKEMYLPVFSHLLSLLSIFSLALGNKTK